MENHSAEIGKCYLTNNPFKRLCVLRMKKKESHNLVP